MRIEDLRIGNYVDVVLKENNTPIRCEVIRIDNMTKSADLKEIDEAFKYITNNSEFTVDTKEKWALVKEVATTEIELKNLEFIYDPELYLDMFSIKGAWFKFKAIVGEHDGIYKLFIESRDALHEYIDIPVPSIHLLQNAVADNYGYRLIRRSSKQML